MRSIIKMLGLAFFATLAFSAVGALSAASASALLFLTANAKESFTVNGLGLQLLLTLSNQGTICHNVLGSGLILNKTDFAHKILLTFHGCESPALGSCQSAGEPNGLIKTLELHALLVTTLSGLYAIVILSEKGEAAEFSCGIAKIKVTGQIAGEFPEKANLEKGTTEAKLTFERKAGEIGMPKITSWWTLEGTAGPNPQYEAEIKALTTETSPASQDGVADITTPFTLKLCHK